MGKVYIPQRDYRVFVRCNTFNQSKYIEDALKGFAMQQTNFPFVCLVMDDCSTDGEQDVIKSWMQRECDMDKAEYIEIELSIIILVPHKSNIQCTFAFYLLKRNTWKEKEFKVAMYTPWREHCEYEALCEGDDYWVDSRKLQKQVDYLDEHLDCTLCATNAIIEVENGELDWTRYGKSCIVHTSDIIVQGGLFLQTASYMIRRGFQDTMPVCGQRCHVGDYPLIIWCALNGHVYYINEKMVTYRYGYGWTKYFNEKPIEERIRGWKSEIEMLKGFDEYSENKYHASFSTRINNYLFYIFSSSPKNYRLLKQRFADDYRLLPLCQKIKLLAERYHLSFPQKVLRIYKQELLTYLENSSLFFMLRIYRIIKHKLKN